MKVSAIAWALRRSLLFAAATAVVALLFATTLSGEGAERLATTAYLAAIFAALALAIQRFLPVAPGDRIVIPQRPFPAFLAFFCAVALLLGAGAMLAPLPGGEALALAACFAIVAFAALRRSGTVAAGNAVLMRGGIVAAAIRYAVVIGIVALASTLVLSPDLAQVAANLAYRLLVVAAIMMAVSLIAPTRAGLFAQRCWAQSAGLLDRMGDVFGHERAASFAALLAVAALVSASLLAGAEAEPLAVAAYAAAVAAAFAVAVECRRLRG